MKLFGIDSPLIKGLGKMADLMALNLLALLCCLPIVTIGASLTSLYYMTLKVVRDEEIYIVKNFFKAFKQNFVKSTIVWLIQIVVMVILISDYYMFFFNETSKFPAIFQVVVLIVTVVAAITFMFVYPLMSKFDNSLKNNFRNAFLLGITQFPKIIVMYILWAVPVVVTIFVIELFPFVLLFGLSLPALLSSLMYNKFFLKLEGSMVEQNAEETSSDTEEERIFSDSDIK